MPSDLWAINIVDGPWKKIPKIRLFRPVRVSDWDRFGLYARRVRSLISGSAIFQPPDASLGALRRRISLYPSFPLPHAHHDIFRPFFRLCILTPIDSGAPRCPRLTTVSIEALGSHGDCSRPLSAFVSVLERVEQLSVPSLEQDALEYLSDLPTLKTLTLKTLPSTLTMPEIRGPQNSLKLRELALDYPNIQPTVQFLALCNAIPLDAFDVCFFDVPTAGEIRDLLVAISAGFSHSTVTKLVLKSKYDQFGDLDPAIYLIPYHSLQHLFCFPNLVVLLIASPLGFDLDDAAVEELACSSPQIEVLRLVVGFTTHAPRTTLACLHSFAQHCPHLRHLTIAFDATSVPSSDANPGAFPLQCFPDLEQIETHREYDDNEDEEELAVHGDAIRLHNHWEEVQELLDQEPSSE
ncbi:hypothetical protein B0H19DRAFT_1259129 [Mycena capillaripes]|nr:hypothetical protein B0H19DRAFT_1259129 [Mycena capillaripes]